MGLEDDRFPFGMQSYILVVFEFKNTELFLNLKTQKHKLFLKFKNNSKKQFLDSKTLHGLKVFNLFFCPEKFPKFYLECHGHREGNGRHFSGGIEIGNPGLFFVEGMECRERRDVQSILLILDILTRPISPKWWFSRASPYFREN